MPAVVHRLLPLLVVMLASTAAAVEVNISAVASSVTEGGSVVLIAQRTGGTGALQVPVALIGAPAFASLDPEFVFAAGASTATLVLTTTGNATVDGPRQVTAQIAVGGGIISTWPAVTVGVRDDEVTVALEALDVLATEDGVPADTARVRIVVGGEPRGGDLVVQFEVHGTATFEGSASDDYALAYTVDGVETAVAPLAGVEQVNVTIPAGVDEAVIVLEPRSDTRIEGAETCEIRLSTASLAYVVAGTDHLPMTIADDDNRIAALAATPAFESGPNGSVTIAFLGAFSGRTVQIPYLVSGVANGTDIVALSGVATLPSGASSVVIVVDALADDEVEGESLILTLLPSADYVLPGTPSIAVPIVDLAGIAGIAVPEAAIESVADQPLRFAVTVERYAGFAAEPLLVPFRIGGGDAAAGAAEYAVGGTGVSWDADARTGVVELGALETVAYIEVVPVDDEVADGDKTVRVTLEDGQSVTVAVGSATADGTIRDDEPAVAIERLGDATITEGGAAAEFLVAYPGVPAGIPRGLPVQVRFSVGGTAAVSDRAIAGAGVAMDGDGLAGTATIPAGALGVAITVTALADAVAEPVERVTLTLAAPAAGSAYRLAAAAAAAVDLVDADARPTVSIAALAAAIEGRTVNCFRISRTGAVDAALDVRLAEPTGSADAGDYLPLPATVRIPAGAADVLLAVTAISDGEDYEDLIVTIAPDDAYLVGIGSAGVDIVAGFADNQLQISSELVDPVLGIDDDWGGDVLLAVPVGVTAGRSRAVLSAVTDGPAVPSWISVHRVTDAGEPGPILFRLQASPPVGTEEGAVPLRLLLQADIDADGTFELALPQDLLLWVRAAEGDG